MEDKEQDGYDKAIEILESVVEGAGAWFLYKGPFTWFAAKKEEKEDQTTQTEETPKS